MSKYHKLYGALAVGVATTLTVAVGFADRFVAQVPEGVRLVEARPAPMGGLIAAAQAAGGDRVPKFGLGRRALPEEIAAWDVEVSPDGSGLPVGSGDALQGEELFEEACAVCHGSFGEGVDNWPMLAGGFGTLADEDPVKTVGSYWPYVSTVWDYVHRSMPFGNAGSLTDDDVYAIVAYILYSNDLIEDDFVVSNETLAGIELPNAGGFVVDDRAATEYAQWRTEPCMENCKTSVEITMRATVLDVTPEDGSQEPETAMTSADAAVDHATAVVKDPPAPAVQPEETVVVAAAVDPALMAAGEKVFKKCKACHQVGEGAKNRSGPQLNAVIGRAVGSVEGFKYSKAMTEMGGSWDAATLAAFLANPRGALKGTKMSFSGLKSDEDIAAVTAYLQGFAE